MTVEKTAPQHEVHSISRSQSIAIGTASNDTHRQQTIAELSKELTRKLNRRGCRLRVKRRRGDTNVVYAEKLRVEIERRLGRAWEHISKLQLEAMDCEHYLALARSDESSLRRKALQP